jgi:hypothetical protein
MLEKPATLFGACTGWSPKWLATGRRVPNRRGSCRSWGESITAVIKEWGRIESILRQRRSRPDRLRFVGKLWLSVDRSGAHEELSDLVGNALAQLMDGFRINNAIRILMGDELVQWVCNGDLRQSMAEFCRWNDGCIVVLLLLATLWMRLGESRIENEVVWVVAQIVRLVARLLVASIDRYILIVTVLVITDILLLPLVVILVWHIKLSRIWQELILIIVGILM